MENEKFTQALVVVEKFQNKVSELTTELKADLKEANLFSEASPNMVEVSAAQELILAAAKQLAFSVKQSLLAHSELDDPKSIVLATKMAMQMADNVLRTCFVDELEKSGVNVKAAEDYAMQKIREIINKINEKQSSLSLEEELHEELALQQELEKKLAEGLNSDEDPTVH